LKGSRRSGLRADFSRTEWAEARRESRLALWWDKGGDCPLWLVWVRATDAMPMSELIRITSGPNPTGF
jgi:hypothetical protein